MNQLLPAHGVHRTVRSRRPALVNSPEEQSALHCRGCSAGGLRTILDLGCLPLANGLLNERQVLEPEPAYPLILVFCSHCALVQITETLPAVDLYRQYVYFSSYSDTMLCESRRIAERMIRVRRLNQNSRVIEIASNDGYLLQFYKEAGISVLGVEPASNVAAAAIGRGIPTVCDFFSHGIAQQLCEEGKRADVIHAHNVLAHVADIHDFFRGLAMLLESDGVIAIEVPYVRDMIEGAEMVRLFIDYCELAESGGALPCGPQDSQRMRYLRREEFDALKRIPPHADAETIDRYARAFWYPPYACAQIAAGDQVAEVFPSIVREELARLHSQDLRMLQDAAAACRPQVAR
jgi:SAM-dependent methyltransferase